MDDPPRPIPLSRRTFHLLTGGWLAANVTGCGTLLYPERVGQPRTGRLDWTVVGMDAIGLIFFFVPGVIAFAIDLYNGAIFYPPAYSAHGHRNELKTVRLGRPHPRLTEVAQVISQELGRPVPLEEGRYVTRQIQSLQQFWPVHDELIQHGSPASPV